MRTRIGDFFGLPAEIGAERIDDAPATACRAWLEAPTTEEALGGEMEKLVRATVLAGDRMLFASAAQALDAARSAVTAEWEAIQNQAEPAPKEGRDSLGFQLKRLVNDNLLRELGSARGPRPAAGNRDGRTRHGGAASRHPAGTGHLITLPL